MGVLRKEWFPLEFIRNSNKDGQTVKVVLRHSRKLNGPGKFGNAESWYPRPELNRDLRFRKPLLYPFKLRGHPMSVCAGKHPKMRQLAKPIFEIYRNYLIIANFGDYTIYRRLV